MCCPISSNRPCTTSARGRHWALRRCSCQCPARQHSAYLHQLSFAAAGDRVSLGTRRSVVDISHDIETRPRPPTAHFAQRLCGLRGRVLDLRRVAECRSKRLRRATARPGGRLRIQICRRPAVFRPLGGRDYRSTQSLLARRGSRTGQGQRHFLCPEHDGPPGCDRRIEQHLSVGREEHRSRPLHRQQPGRRQYFRVQGFDFGTYRFANNYGDCSGGTAYDVAGPHPDAPGYEYPLSFGSPHFVGFNIALAMAPCG